MSHQELEALIMNTADLPTIPVVATKVMQLIEDENATSEELARVVAADPAVAARVLKISNSSFYGCQRKIQTLSHAIMVLGFGTLRSLVVAASIKQVYKPYGLTEKMLWEHSFCAGLAARIIAGATRMVNEEEAFLGGLFHDIGKIIMNTMDKQQFQAVMQRCFNERLTFQAAERQVYPYTHADVGALVIRKWNFPDILMHAVQKHHSLDFPDYEDPYQKRLTCIVALANLCCHTIGIGVREPEEILLHETPPAVHLGLEARHMDFLLESFMDAVNRNREYFS